MSLDLPRQDEQPLTSVDQLVAFFQRAERPIAEHQVGLEHEKLVYPVGSAHSAAYAGPRGIGALLAALQPHGYEAFREFEAGPTIALQRGTATISLEPGGQFELSGQPFRTAREAHAENLAHLEELKRAAGPLGLRFVALGYRPFDALNEMTWMPKTRYEVMRRTLPQRGALAVNMMLMTATGQVSLDWRDEQDCARKVMVTARLTPLMIALYANSPLVEGQPVGFLSYRSRVWQEVDPLRCGYLPSMIDGSFSYRAYVDWALDAPLLFLRRGGKYQTPQLTFRQLLAEGFEGRPAIAGDWTDHLSTLFPEVRLKKVLEVRGADCVSAAQTGALAALWRGILYDPTALAEAEALLPRLRYAEHLEFHHTSRSLGLKGKLGNLELSRLAQEMVAIASRGLFRLDPADAPLLEPLREIAASGVTPAERLLAAWQRERDPSKVLDHFEL